MSDVLRVSVVFNLEHLIFFIFNVKVFMVLFTQELTSNDFKDKQIIKQKFTLGHACYDIF